MNVDMQTPGDIVWGRMKTCLYLHYFPVFLQLVFHKQEEKNLSHSKMIIERKLLELKYSCRLKEKSSALFDRVRSPSIVVLSLF